MEYQERRGWSMEYGQGGVVVKLIAMDDERHDDYLRYMTDLGRDGEKNDLKEKLTLLISYSATTLSHPHTTPPLLPFLLIYAPPICLPSPTFESSRF